MNPIPPFDTTPIPMPRTMLGDDLSQPSSTANMVVPTGNDPVICPYEGLGLPISLRNCNLVASAGIEPT